MERWQRGGAALLPQREHCPQMAHHWRAPWSNLFQATKPCRWASRQTRGVLPSCTRPLARKSSLRVPHHMARTDWPPGGQQARTSSISTKKCFEQSHKSVSNQEWCYRNLLCMYIFIMWIHDWHTWHCTILVVLANVTSIVTVKDRPSFCCWWSIRIFLFSIV